MAVKISPFLIVREVSFPAHFDVLAIQSTMNVSSSPTNDVGLGAQQASIGLSYSGVIIGSVGSHVGNGALFTFNEGTNVGSSPPTPVNPFTTAMEEQTVLFSPAGNSAGFISQNPGKFGEIAGRGYLFLNLSLLTKLLGSPGSVLIQVTLPGTNNTQSGVLLEVYNAAKSMPITSLNTVNLVAQGGGWTTPRVFHAQKNINPTTAASEPAIVTAGFLVQGLNNRNYSIIDDGTGGLASGMSASFTSGSG